MGSSNSRGNHDSFYSKAHLYEIAFQFKDVVAENSTLISLYETTHGCRPRSFLEIAAGPATNALQMHETYGLDVSALDYSEQMVAYGQSEAHRRSVPLQYLQGDMRDFSLPAPVDIAAMFMASTGYLLSNESMIEHLQAVARILSQGGLYVVEMSHPRDIFGVGSSTSQEWEEVRDDCKVKVTWGSPNDVFDPITQIRLVTAHLAYNTPSDAGEIVNQSPQREFSFQEMHALVKLSGVFDWVNTLGAWDVTIPLSNEPRSWRMILVLRKRA